MVARSIQAQAIEQHRLDGKTLPVLEQMKAGGSGWPLQRVTPGAPRISTRVMIIDKSLTVRTVVQTCLRRVGCEVIAFPDGVQALHWLNRVEQVLPLDFLLLDLDIPRMDWYQVLQQFKLQPACTDTLVVILSRRDGLLDRLKACLAGAHDYLSKPFRTQDLLTIICHESDPGIDADEWKRRPRCS